MNKRTEEAVISTARTMGIATGTATTMDYATVARNHESQPAAATALRHAYTAPRVEVIEMENEGVIAASRASGGATGVGGGGSAFSSSRPSGRGMASQSDIESMIEDIFTIER